MDPYEKYDMIFNGAAPARVLTSSPGKYAGEDNGWVLSLIEPVILDFDKSIMKYPSIKRFPGGASTDLVPNLQHPENPLPILKDVTRPARSDGWRRLIALRRHWQRALVARGGGGFGHPPFRVSPFKWRGTMKVFSAESRRGATWMRRFVGSCLAAALSIAGIAAARADRGAAGRRADGGRREGSCASMVCADAGG